MLQPTIHFRALMAAGLVLGFRLTGLAQNSPAPVRTMDCAQVLEKMRKDFAIEPGRLILITEDALITNEICVCPIIRTAVNLAGSDTALTGRVVIAAIRLIPTCAAQITGCAMEEAPAAASEIKAALSKELGASAAPWLEPSKEATGTASEGPSEKSADGKAPLGKAPATGLPASPGHLLESEEGEEYWPSVGVAGIYLIGPVAARAQAPNSTVIRTLHEVFTPRTPPPRRPSSPISRSLPE